MKYTEFMKAIVEFLTQLDQSYRWAFRHYTTGEGKPSYPTCTIYTTSTMGGPQMSFEVSVNRVLHDGALEPTWSDHIGTYDVLRIYGTIARDSKGHEWTSIRQIPHITVSLKKTPKQIAAEILRRAVKPMIPAMEEIWGKIAAAELKYSRENTTAAAIISALKLDQEAGPEIYVATYANGLQFNTGSQIKVCGEEVVLNLQMPSAFAIEVCKAIAAVAKQSMKPRTRTCKSKAA